MARGGESGPERSAGWLYGGGVGNAARLLVASLALFSSPEEGDFAVGQVGGRPVIFENGEPLFPQCFFNTSWKVEVVTDDLARSFAKQGVRIHQFDVGLDWGRSGAYKGLDDRVRGILGFDGSALFMFRTHLFAPKSWYDEQPDEIVRVEDGSPVPCRVTAASYASERWRTGAGERLQALVKHVLASDYRDHVLGYLLFAGWSGEWNWFVSSEKGSGRAWAKRVNCCVDHSEVMKRTFRDWVRDEYAGDVSRLRSAWRDAEVTFETVSVPSGKALGETGLGGLRDPAGSSWVPDYFRCYSQQMTKSLLHFARIVKETCPRALVGAFWGEFFFSAIGGAREILRTGHLDMNEVLCCPHIDFLCSPNAYQTLRVGGCGASMCLTDSIALHDKLCFYEFDQPTHLYRGERPRAQDTVPKDMAETEAVLKRGFAACLCKGLGIWWWDQESRRTQAVAGGVWYKDPGIRHLFGEFQRIGRDSLERDCSSVSEVAVVFDPRSLLYVRPGFGGVIRVLLYDQLEHLGHIGAPYDVYAFSDLPEMRPYKLYIFLNLFYATEEERKTVGDVLKKARATAIWLYAPGCLTPDGLDLEAATELTGIRLACRKEQGTWQAKVTDPSEALCAGVPEVLGADLKTGPLFYVDDEGAQTYATSLDGGLPLLATKRSGGVSSVFVGFAPACRELLRNVCRLADVHLYTGVEDVVYANKSYLAVHGALPGLREVWLPQASRVTDAFTGKLLADSTLRIEFEVDKPATRLFLIERP